MDMRNNHVFVEKPGICKLYYLIHALRVVIIHWIYSNISLQIHVEGHKWYAHEIDSYRHTKPQFCKHMHKWWMTILSGINTETLWNLRIKWHARNRINFLQFPPPTLVNKTFDPHILSIDEKMRSLNTLLPNKVTLRLKPNQTSHWRLSLIDPI